MPIGTIASVMTTRLLSPVRFSGHGMVRRSSRRALMRRRIWTVPRRITPSIISKSRAGMLCLRRVDISQVAANSGGTGDGPYRLYDPVLGGFLQKDPNPLSETIIAKTFGNGMGIFASSMFICNGISIMGGSSNLYPPIFISGAYDPTGEGCFVSSPGGRPVLSGNSNRKIIQCSFALCRRFIIVPEPI
jgi:hypothetical protein